jgi:replicative DNA helicase
MNPSKLRAKVRGMIHTHDIKILAVDYVQLLNSNRDSREQQVAEISRTCKAIAKEYGIPVLGLSQLNRSCEYRSGWNKRPQLSDLRESGAIEQDADVVISIFRPDYYGLETYPNGEGTEGITELAVLKHRNGPTGMKKLTFDKTQMKFKNLTNRSMEQARQRAKEQKQQFEDNSPF